MKEVRGHAVLPAPALMGISYAQRKGPMTVVDLHSADTVEENGPIEIVGKFLTSALELLKCHLPDLLTPKEHLPTGVLLPVSLSQIRMRACPF